MKNTKDYTVKTSPKIIKMSYIVKLQHWYIEIFSEEDDDYPNYGRIALLNRNVERVLNKITDNQKRQKEIYDAIQQGSWDNEDKSYKPICDKLRKLGYEIIQGE